MAIIHPLKPRYAQRTSVYPSAAKSFSARLQFIERKRFDGVAQSLHQLFAGFAR
jgi:hypothetical protein